MWDDQKDIQELDQEDQGASEETGELAANEQKESTQFDEKQEGETETSDNENEMENVDDVQLENDESDHEMDVDPTNEQVKITQFIYTIISNFRQTKNLKALTKLMSKWRSSKIMLNLKKSQRSKLMNCQIKMKPKNLKKTLRKLKLLVKLRRMIRTIA